MTYDHSNRTHTSQTMLKQLDVSVARFKGLYVDDPPTIADKDTPDRKEGRALHGLVLQPERFEEMFPIMPRYELDDDNKTAGGKKSTSKSTIYYQSKKEAFELANADKDVIDLPLLARLRAMKSAILEHEEARWILDSADAFEVPHFWHNKIDRRCQMDIVCTSLSLVADIKKFSGPPTTEAFAREARKWRFWIQAPWYLQAAADKYGEGVITRFVFICVNSQPPHQVGLHQFDDQRPAWALGENDCESDLAWATRRTEELVDELIRRRETGNWTDAWSRGINKVPMPKYLRSKFYDVEEEAEDEAA